jgi:hypothetical protein
LATKSIPPGSCKCRGEGRKPKKGLFSGKIREREQEKEAEGQQGPKMEAELNGNGQCQEKHCLHPQIPQGGLQRTAIPAGDHGEYDSCGQEEQLDYHVKESRGIS